MSGPKVVRVVTREELEAIGRRQIAIVEAAITNLRAILGRYGVQEPALENALVERRQALHDLLAKRQFRELQSQAGLQAEFFRSKAIELERQAIARLEAARTRRRRLSDAARSVASAMAATGQAVPAELRDVITRSLSADDQALAGLQRVVDNSFRLLAPTAPSGGALSDKQVELARRLAATEQRQTLADWLAKQPVRTDTQTTRLDQVLAEVESLGNAPLGEEFASRAVAVAAEVSADRRRLLMDSLILDAGAAIRRLRGIAGAHLHLRELLGALAAYTTADTLAVAGAIKQALERPAEAPPGDLAGQAEAAIERAQKQLAAAARRQAVLGGLASMGYEVRETMATAWARDGRLIVRKPGSTDYGVELAAPADAARLQVRVVGAQTPVEPRSTSRDRDQEAAWCSDFGKLQKVVAEAGGGIEIERALEVGAQAVKTVPFEGVFDEASADVARPLERRL